MEKSGFQTAHEFVARWEGGIVDIAQDRGGVTAYGASLAYVKDLASTPAGKNFLASIGVKPLPPTRSTILNLTREQVARMFRRTFWDALRLDELPLRGGALIYDMAVNHGPKNAVKMAQRGYNATVTYGAKLDVDGIMGPLTRKAYGVVTDKIIKAACQARRDFYDAIVKNDASQKIFLKGWLNRANALEKLLMGMSG